MEHIKTSPKDSFLYLLSNVALYYCAGWMVSLLYDYINFIFGTTNYYDGSAWFSGSMRWAIASLVIVFPVYILVTRYLNRDLEAHPEKRDLRVRKWLIYLTLSLASVALIVDVIALVYQFLSGEFAMTFFLKVLSVAVVSGLVWGYYYYELRRDALHGGQAGKAVPSRLLFRYVSIVLVVAAIIGGFFIVGSPTSARLRQYDMQRVSDLGGIQWQVVDYWQSKEKLPASLSQLNNTISGYTVPSDPEGKMYEYIPGEGLSFELCATFAQSGSSNENIAMPKQPGGLYGDQNWQHGAGRVCFERVIDPDFYPVRTK